MTKISWICDFDCMIGEGGGGELSERAIIVEGIRRGHDILMCTPNTPNSCHERGSSDNRERIAVLATVLSASERTATASNVHP
jgi:hypothetical protein